MVLPLSILLSFFTTALQRPRGLRNSVPALVLGAGVLLLLAGERYDVAAAARIRGTGATAGRNREGRSSGLGGKTHLTRGPSVRDARRAGGRRAPSNRPRACA